MRHPSNKMSNSERNQDEPELIQKGQDINRLRELILEGAASPLIEEPLNADYFEKLRKRVLNRD